REGPLTSVGWSKSRRRSARSLTIVRGDLRRGADDCHKSRRKPGGSGDARGDGLHFLGEQRWFMANTLRRFADLYGNAFARRRVRLGPARAALAGTFSHAVRQSE